VTPKTPKKDLEDYISKYGMETLLHFLRDYVHRQLLQISCNKDKGDPPDYLVTLYIDLVDTYENYHNRNKNEV
jgi:hypothetical protein